MRDRSEEPLAVPAIRAFEVPVVARRRGDEPAAVAREVERIAGQFDVDAVYVAPASEASGASEPGSS